MSGHLKIVVWILMIGTVLLLSYKLILPRLESDNQKQTSDARATKGKILIGVDNWIGYYPLCSKVMRKHMYRIGYQLECVDDKADYALRMKKLKKSDLQFAVATVDSYLLNGEDVNYPGTIISVIDESKGGDAIVAWKNKVKSIDALKTANIDLKIAYTAASPSEHLLKSVAVHFDVPMLRNKKAGWRVEADGSQAALKLLQDKKVDVAVLWEPDVSRALSNKKITKLLGTEDTKKLIVDILIVNRNYAQDNPDVVTALLRNYFRTLKFYKSNQSEFIDDIADDTNISKKKISTLLKGVSWVNLSQNAQNWFGTMSYGNTGSEGLVDTIESTAEILVDSGDFSTNPLPNKDPYRIINSQYLINLYENTATAQFGQVVTNSVTNEQSLETKFTKLSKQAWAELRVIGTLKIRSIVFQSGADKLTLAGKEQLDKAAENLKHYPKFRVIIKGHTGTRGDKVANKLLSKNRAKSVARYLKVTYGLNSNRILTKGLGGIKPLKRKPGESFRAFNYRLPRVELFLVAEDI